jgi:23S rRNA (guanosine2251-2'-O)-methyltransferase
VREKHKTETSVLVGRRPVLELLRSGRAAERVLIANHMRPSPVVAEIRRRAESLAVPVRFVPRDEIERVAKGLNHQGVAAVTGRYRYTPLEDVLRVESPCVLFLDGVTDPQNLGSLLRSADCAGFDGLVIPAHRSAHVTGTVRRVSAGASEVLPVARVTNLGRALDEAREAGLWVVGLDADAENDLWSSNLAEPPVGLVLGAEDRGLSKSVRERCDELVRIPQAGRIGSLNVAVAGALAMFEVARRRAS